MAVGRSAGVFNNMRDQSGQVSGKRVRPTRSTLARRTGPITYGFNFTFGGRSSARKSAGFMTDSVYRE